MASKPLSSDILNDSEAALRLVDDVVSELRGVDDEIASHVATLVPGFGSESAPDLTRLPQVLLSAYGEIVAVLERLQKSRGILQRVAMDRLQRTHEKLAEVNTATEMAASDMLDGLDRALGLVDRLEEPALDPADAAATRNSIRDELHQLISCLQFQDITSQQLTYASSVLVDLEQRLHAIVTMFGYEFKPGFAPVADAGLEASSTFDPAASTHDAEIRQAVADEIFFAGPRPA